MGAFRNSVLVMIAAVSIPLAAGEYSAWSPGIQLQLSQATGNTFVPFQSQTGNIQGATVDTLYGIGFANQVRMGEAYPPSDRPNWYSR